MRESSVVRSREKDTARTVQREEQGVGGGGGAVGGERVRGGVTLRDK